MKTYFPRARRPFATTRVALAVAVLAGCGQPVLGAPSAIEGLPVGAASTPVGTGAATAATPADAPVGTWYLDIDGVRRTLTLAIDGDELSGTLSTEDTPVATAALEAVAFDPSQHTLRFVVPAGAVADRTWFQLSVYGPVLVGRAATPGDGTAPAIAGYTTHVHGWNATALDVDLAPRAFDLAFSDGRRATLRLDRAAPGAADFVGTLKVYATTAGTSGEGEQYELGAIAWDGAALSFTRDDGGATWTYTAQAQGRTLTGVESSGATTEAWTGTRAEVLGHGLVPVDVATRSAWQARTGDALRGLMMAGAPAPIATRVTVLRSDVAPFALTTLPSERDDDVSVPQAYAMTELAFEFTLADPAGGAPVVRVAHAYLARPTTAPPPGGYPVALALNGHYGSAHQVMDPNSGYWYGDGYARRGYVVIALDVSHRPPGQRAPDYADVAAGDDAANGNGPHPAIAFDGLDSDWSEDGERTWDAMRALDYVLAQPDVDPRRATAIGLSMGGEVGTLVAALDPRIRDAAVAGFSPDLSVLLFNGNHICWQLPHADLREYLEVSDLHALIAPRGLVVETGQSDPTFSHFVAPFAGDKQVLRRSRAAYDSDAATAHALVHYLHPGFHTYHVAAPAPGSMDLRGIAAPVLRAPTTDDPLDWQTSAETVQERATVFDFVAHFATTR